MREFNENQYKNQTNPASIGAVK